MIKKDSVQLKYYKKWDSNPFIPGMVGTAKVGRSDVKYAQASVPILNHATGEVRTVIGNAWKVNKRQDQTEFSKLFRDGLPVLAGLSKTGMLVFLYFVSELQKKKDTVIFDPREASKFAGVKFKHHLYNGIRSLLDNGVIAKTMDTGVYFINPGIIFNGDRMPLIREVVDKELTPINKLIGHDNTANS